MNITIYRKTRTTKPTDGSKARQFYVYITRLCKKNGDIITAEVKLSSELKSEMDKRAKYPVNVLFDKKDANLQTKTGTTKDGELVELHVLWLKRINGYEDFVDTSLDDFE